MAKGKTPEQLLTDMSKPKPIGLFAWLRGRFFAGMVIAAPLAATFFILQFLITFIDNRVKPLLPPMLKTVSSSGMGQHMCQSQVSRFTQATRSH